MKRGKKQKGNYAFIDSQNLNVGVQKFGWKMDWKKFRKFLSDQYNVSSAYMFIGYVPEFEPMYEQLHEAGYKIVLKPTFDLTRLPEKPDKEEQEKQVKGNIDADLVLWCMKELANYNKAVIVSGDGDFYALVEFLKQQNKLQKLLAPNSHYSSLFNQFKADLVRLDTHKSELAYHDKKPKNRQGTRPKNIVKKPQKQG